jgi:UDP-N-acetylmuramoylalanine--D-glutamate ligase
MKEEDFAVVELSSFQLMDMKRSPSRAIVTNLAPNHLDVHKDMEEYVEAKKNIFKFQDENGFLILNADNDITSSFTGNGTTKFFSRQGHGYVELRDGVIYRGEEAVLPVADILIPGVHNIENYMAAIAAVEGLVSNQTVQNVAKTFGGVEHRIELVRIKEGVRYYNDSIASSPSRTIAGLRCFEQKVILIAGGYDKHIPYDVLGPEICTHVKKLILGGATGPLIQEAVEKCEGEKPEIVDCGDFTSAVRAAAEAAQPGDVVLMSPASAAFDQFKNFMVRGQYFKKLIMEM